MSFVIEKISVGVIGNKNIPGYIRDIKTFVKSYAVDVMKKENVDKIIITLKNTTTNDYCSYRVSETDGFDGKKEITIEKVVKCFYITGHGRTEFSKSNIRVPKGVELILSSDTGCATTVGAWNAYINTQEYPSLIFRSIKSNDLSLLRDVLRVNNRLSHYTTENNLNNYVDIQLDLVANYKKWESPSGVFDIEDMPHISDTKINKESGVHENSVIKRRYPKLSEVVNELREREEYKGCEIAVISLACRIVIMRPTTDQRNRMVHSRERNYGSLELSEDHFILYANIPQQKKDVITTPLSIKDIRLYTNDKFSELTQLLANYDNVLDIDYKPVTSVNFTFEIPTFNRKTEYCKLGLYHVNEILSKQKTKFDYHIGPANCHSIFTWSSVSGMRESDMLGEVGFFTLQQVVNIINNKRKMSNSKSSILHIVNALPNK